MNFRRLTTNQLIAILALLALLAAYLILASAYWRMDIQCGNFCNGIHALKGAVLP